MISWAIFARESLRAFKIGFQMKTLTPYAHCRKPLPARVYRLGAFTPGLVLGLLPSFLGIATGNGWFLWFGLLFTFAAGGDMLILWIIRRVPSAQWIEDHPSRAGCYVIDPGLDQES